MKLQTVALALFGLLAVAQIDGKDVRVEASGYKRRSAKSSARGGIRGIRGIKERTLQTETTNNLEEGDTGIIGGTDAGEGDYPFYVKFEGSTLCGGSLVSPDTIITAAHCVPANNGSPGQVRIGGNTYNGGTLADIQCAVAHPDFAESSTTLLNDIAVVKLENPVSISPVNFNKVLGYPSVGGSKLTVIGFGLTSPSGSVASTLQQLETSFVTAEDCQATYSAQVVQNDDHICADVPNAGDCNGDSGGPVLDENGVQVGIVSFGYGGCASDGFQDVYVNVANYQSWIQSYIDGSDCQPSDSTTSTESGSTNTDGSNNGDGGGDGGESDPVGNQGNNQEEENDNGKNNGKNGEEEGDEEEEENNKNEGDDEENDKDEGGDEQGGDEQGDDDESTADLSTVNLDTFLDCFTTVVDLIQNVLGGGAGNAAGRGGQGLGVDGSATEENTNGPAGGLFASRFNRDADRDFTVLNNFEVDGEPMDEVLGLNGESEGGDR